MIDAWSCLDPQNLRNGFYYTGIYPFNPKKGLDSKYVTENDNNNEILHGGEIHLIYQIGIYHLKMND